MTDHQRRWLCRAAFLALCVVPTVGTGVWAARAHAVRLVEQQQAEWQARMLRELGLRGTVEGVEEGERGDVILTGLALQDPETRATIVEARRVHVAPAGDRGWVVDVAYPRIPADELLRLWAPIYDRLRRSRGDTDWSGLVVANNVTLTDARASQTLSQVECQFGSSRSGAMAQVAFLVAGLRMSERAKLVVARDRERDPPETIVLFQTGSTPLPCSLLATQVPALRYLGEHCQFQGTIKCRLGEGGWRGEELNGRLEKVDFAALVTELFPHHLLSGLGAIEIRQAAFVAGRLVSAEGTIAIDAGVISRSLLESAGQWLGWRLAEPPAGGDDSRVRFSRLDLEFRVDGAGLTVRSRVPDDRAIVWGDAGPLAWPAEHAVPVTNVVRLLVPDSRHQVPATRQTGWLASLLPIPSIVPTRTASQPNQSPPLRLGTRRD